jgi:hypothetical protein
MGISSGEASQTAAALAGVLRCRLMADATLKDVGLRRMNGMGGPSGSSSRRPKARQRPSCAVVR